MNDFRFTTELAAMKTKIGSIIGVMFGSAILLGAPVGAEAASVMRSPTGFSAWVTVTGFEDLNGSFDISLSAVTGTVEFDNVNLNQDIHAVGGVTITDSPGLIIQETFNGDVVFSGALGIDTTGSFSFDGVSVPQNYPTGWTLTYDGTTPSAIFPIMPPLPMFPGDLAGSLTFAVDSIGKDFLNLTITETVVGWSGFEAYLKFFDSFTSTIGTIDARLDIAQGTEFNTPLPAALWLLASALAGLGVVTRRKRRD